MKPYHWTLQFKSGNILQFPGPKYAVISYIVIGYFLSLFNEREDPATWRVLKEINARKKKDFREAMLFLDRQVRPFLAVTKETTMEVENIFAALHDVTVDYCDFSAQYVFSVQYHVFHSHTGIHLMSFPSKFHAKRKQIFLLATMGTTTLDTSSLKIVALITNLTGFFTNFGRFCFFCKKQFRGNGTQHKCPLADNCFVCRRPYMPKEMFDKARFLKYFCDSNLYPRSPIECPNCGVRILTSNCNIFHKKRVCRWGFYCSDCNTYQYQSKYYSVKTLKEEHICGKKNCYFCGQVLEQKPDYHHCCKIRLPKKDKNFTFLGFLDAQVSGYSAANCQDCLEKKNREPCTFCEDNVYQDITFCTFLCENREVCGSFDRFSISESHICVKKNEITIPYAEIVTAPLKRTGYLTKFQVKQKVFVSPATFPKERNVINYLFYLIEMKKLHNYTILVHDEEHKVLHLLALRLKSFGFFVDIIGSSTIIAINVPTLALRFVNSENYFDVTSASLERTLHIKPFFFPTRWNKKSKFLYCSKVPGLNDFFSFHDSKDIIEEKKTFLAKISMSGNWCWLENMTTFSLFKVTALAKVCLVFLRNSFLCQQKLMCVNSYCSPSLIHPFNPPTCTQAGYAYKLMCEHSPKMKEICVIRRPVHLQSSKGELEFCSYMKWQNPSKKSCSAWSPYGQRRFKEAVPDLVLDDTMFFWNGCSVHGHPTEKCLYKYKTRKRKNPFGQDAEEAFAAFEAKKARLSANHAIIIKDMWQCEWEKQKDVDDSVKYFLKHVYRNPPLYRLDPRAAG